ncbi:MAG TPA: hypothetical protein DCQ04_13295 [Actinobacteria bacterium]|nr:hypothetical protein [Actinomycetota bacterium]
MTPPLPLAELVTKWRTLSVRHGEHGDCYRKGQGWGLADCASELESALAALPLGRCETCREWQDIASAPTDRRIDLWAKAWLPAFDRFESQRFPNCRWMSGDSMRNLKPYWLNLDKGWFPTHWQPLPAPPADGEETR